MFSRRLYRRQRGRRPLTAVAAAGLVVGLLVAGNTALAVHDEGVFQLDGNAIASPAVSTQNNPGSDTTGAHDWDQVYNDQTAPYSSGATAQAFVTDVTGAGDSILTGGSTKDIYDLPSWLWKKTAVTSVQDKDDIEHAFAAQYSVDKSGGQCGSAHAQNPCVLLYFGADRFANSGSTTMGFWFYKNRVGPVGPDAAGNGTFSGTHTARSANGHGDILIVSDFLIGGAAPTVSVYEWVASGGNTTTNLDLIGGGTATLASCTSAPPTKKNGPSVPPVGANDDLCATTNQNVLTSPWTFTAKTGQTGQQVSEFMEGGINMTALGLGNECFNSFLAETRSSPSPTSTLSDFALGSFGSCGATAVTTPSAGTGADAVSPGTDVTDHFVVTGTSSGGTPPYPTSDTTKGGHNVTFAYCGPVATGTCDGSDAAHTAGAAFDSEALANTATQGVSEATSSAINTSADPLAPGRYCFVGSWAGDNNYTDGASDSSAGECFVVRTIPTTTVTTPSDSGGTALSGTQALGTTLYDVAVVTANASGGGPVTGTVDFFVCKPGETTGAAGAETCPDPSGTALAGNPRTLVAVSPATTPPSSSIISSPGVTANVAGVYCFRAVYTPTGSTYTGSSDSRHSECVTVGPENTTTVTTPSITSGAVNASVTDTAIVSAVDDADGYPSGTINFFICNPATVTANGGDCHTGGTAAGSKAAAEFTGPPTPAHPSSRAVSDAITASSVGVWCFRAEYVPGAPNGGNYNGSSDGRTTECFTITDSTGETSAQTWLPNDTGTVSATGGTALTGTLSIQLYEGSSCAAGSEVAGQVYSKQLTAATTLADRSLTTSNSTYSVSASKSVSWKVTFTPDAGTFLGNASSHCESTSLTITN